jgi:hypothetical protein
LLTAAAAAGGALATQALVRPDPAAAAGVVLGATNDATATTTIRNTTAANNSVAVKGVVTTNVNGGATAGVWGQSNAQGGSGVFGIALAGNSKGVWGRSTDGRGVYGEATDPNAVNFGIYGESKSSQGYGVLGVGHIGVRGKSDDNIGMYASGPTTGVWANSSDTAVYGSGGFRGVWGTGATGVRGEGTTYGVYGNGTTYGVFGKSTAYGVYGDGDIYGLRGEGGTYGAYLTGASYGVYASAPSYAAWFNGKVHVTGALEKPGGSFVIDHPQDPAHRTLEHSFVEAPERLNVYRGTVVLDARGRATIRMPRYFRALNVDFGYQLTPLGSAAPELHVAREITNGSFAIAGGVPGQKVCWVVTGSRQDAWARAHPLRVDRAKRGEARGRYYNPELFGKPRSASIHRPPPSTRRHASPAPVRPSGG